MGIQRRNCEFAICSRLLRESVEVFGEHRGWFDASTSTWTGVAGPFFCGMSFRAVVPELAIALNGPTSTSKQLSVATRFGGDDGIILELNNRGAWHSEYARAFGCSWLSNFHAEDEWLFCGGRHRLRIEGVRDIESKSDFAPSLRAIFFFDAMLRRSETDRGARSKIRITKTDVRVLEALIRHRLQIAENKFGAYVNRTFEAFCTQRRRVRVSLPELHSAFERMKHFVLETRTRYDSNLLTNVVLRLFPNLRVVEVLSSRRIPFLECPFSLPSFARLLASDFASANGLTLKVMAHWKSAYIQHRDAKSWLFAEYHRKATLRDDQTLSVEFETKTIGARLPTDVMTLRKRSRI